MSIFLSLLHVFRIVHLIPPPIPPRPGEASSPVPAFP